MESAKQGSSETSSEENYDREEQVKEDLSSSNTTITAKRSYECSFCKRGFTNAQALGGHMNIHRKDRVVNRTKGKQLASSSSVSSKGGANEEIKNPRYMVPNSSEPTKFYPVLEAERNYGMYFQQPGSSPRQPYSYKHGSHGFLVPGSQSLSMNEELWGTSLSLQIGSANIQDNGGNRTVSDDDEVDLELRLGHDR